MNNTENFTDTCHVQCTVCKTIPRTPIFGDFASPPLPPPRHVWAHVALLAPILPHSASYVAGARAYTPNPLPTVGFLSRHLE